MSCLTIDQVLCARWVLKMDVDGKQPGRDTIVDFGAVLVKDGRIVDVLKTTEVKEMLDNKSLVVSQSIKWMGARSVLMPGLINMHCHSAMTLLRGLADDYSLSDWLHYFVFPAEKLLLEQHTDAYIRLGTKLTARELALLGTTTAMDMYYQEDLVEEEFRKAGLRLATSRTLTDLGQADIEGDVAKCVEYAKKADDPYVQHCFSLHSLYTTGPAIHQSVIEANKKLYRQYYIHMNETEAEEQLCRAKSLDGKTSAIDTLEALGGLNDNFVGVHCVHLTDDEIAKLARHQAHVCHCPRSNYKLGSGTCRVRALMDAGVNVCLGTDSACSNNSLDMLAEVQAAVLHARGTFRDPVNLSAYEALCMATRNGAKALKRDHEIGSLEKGKWADIISIDLSFAGERPIFDVISELVLTTTPKVQNVWVGGKQIVCDGDCLTVKVDRAEASQLAGVLKSLKVDLEAQYAKSKATKADHLVSHEREIATGSTIPSEGAIDAIGAVGAVGAVGAIDAIAVGSSDAKEELPGCSDQEEAGRKGESQGLCLCKHESQQMSEVASSMAREVGPIESQERESASAPMVPSEGAVETAVEAATGGEAREEQVAGSRCAGEDGGKVEAKEEHSLCKNLMSEVARSMAQDGSDVQPESLQEIQKAVTEQGATEQGATEQGATEQGATEQVAVSCELADLAIAHSPSEGSAKAPIVGEGVADLEDSHTSPGGSPSIDDLMILTN